MRCLYTESDVNYEPPHHNYRYEPPHLFPGYSFSNQINATEEFTSETSVHRLNISRSILTEWAYHFTPGPGIISSHLIDAVVFRSHENEVIIGRPQAALHGNFPMSCWLKPSITEVNGCSCTLCKLDVIHFPGFLVRSAGCCLLQRGGGSFVFARKHGFSLSEYSLWASFLTTTFWIHLFDYSPIQSTFALNSLWLKNTPQNLNPPNCG